MACRNRTKLDRKTKAIPRFCAPGSAQVDIYIDLGLTHDGECCKDYVTSLQISAAQSYVILCCAYHGYQDHPLLRFNSGSLDPEAQATEQDHGDRGAQDYVIESVYRSLQERWICFGRTQANQCPPV
jgi:hypothetical protein